MIKNKIRSWIIRKLGAVPIESVITPPIQFEEKPVVTIRSMINFNSHECARLSPENLDRRIRASLYNAMDAELMPHMKIEKVYNCSSDPDTTTYCATIKVVDET